MKFNTHQTVVFSVAALTTSVQADFQGYRFDEQSGLCKNQNGYEGHNPKYLGECGDLRDENLTYLARLELGNMPTNFKGALLRGADLRGLNLSLCDFTGADLREARLDHAQIVKSKFKNTQIREASFQSAMIDDSIFEDVRAYQADFTETQFKDVRFVRGDLEETIFAQSNLERVTFDKTQTPYTRFFEATLESVEFRQSKGKRLEFESSVLRGVVFMGADHPYARLTFVRVLDSIDPAQKGNVIEASSFKGARIYKSQLSGTTLKDSNFSFVNFSSTDFSNSYESGSSFKFSVYDSQTRLPFSEDEAKNRGFRMLNTFSDSI
jgi:uncharacterized protein YjbI with pentapeptide repeats